MDLDTALKGMLDAENELRTPQGVANPVIMSSNMMRLSQYVGAVEEYLAAIEARQELAEAKVYYQEKSFGKSPSAAEKEAKYATAIDKADIKRLTRLVASGWKQTSIIQSRINHLTTQANSTNL